MLLIGNAESGDPIYMYSVQSLIAKAQPYKLVLWSVNDEPDQVLTGQHRMECPAGGGGCVHSSRPAGPRVQQPRHCKSEVRKKPHFSPHEQFSSRP